MIFVLKSSLWFHAKVLMDVGGMVKHVEVAFSYRQKRNVSRELVANGRIHIV
jgi:hypothetical protein